MEPIMARGADQPIDSTSLCVIIESVILHVYLVRHGQTYFNRYNRLQGWSDSPLTEQGFKDAHTAALKLKDIDFAAAYCSDTSRATLTAQHILEVNRKAGHPAVELTRDMHFREQFYGYFEGQDMNVAWWAAGASHGAGTYKLIVERHGLAATRDWLKLADPFHDAESDEEYWHRIEGGYRLMAERAERAGLHEGENILQISHGNTLLSLVTRYATEGFDLSERPANGSVTLCDFDTQAPIDRALSIVSYNR